MYCISITTKQNKAYVGELNLNGMPIETSDKNKALTYKWLSDAEMYAAVLNVNLMSCYKANKTPQENQYYYRAEELNN